MKVAIMQPYFMPYIGYFQLINSVDKFVVYDNIQYTKKGWINRNRILVNGTDEYITLPLKKDSDFLDINRRELSDDCINEKSKILRKLKSSYSKAPQFENVFPVLTDIFNCASKNLFDFIFNSLQVLTDYLGIKTELIISSGVPVDHGLKSQEKVLAICNSLGAEKYINPIGGLDLYSGHAFRTRGVDLLFIKSRDLKYPQFNNEFVSWLSIIDIMMFNSKDTISRYLNTEFDLISQ